MSIPENDWASTGTVSCFKSDSKNWGTQMGQAILITVVAGVLTVGATRVGSLAVKGAAHVGRAFHHHVDKPVGHAIKAVAVHQVKK